MLPCLNKCVDSGTCQVCLIESLPFLIINKSQSSTCREQSCVEGIIKIRLFATPYPYRIRTVYSTVYSGFFSLSLSLTDGAVMSSAVTHSWVSQCELFLDELFRVISGKEINKSTNSWNILALSFLQILF